VNGNYSYDDVPAGQIDLQLAYFSIAHDAPYIIRLLQQALLISRHDATCTLGPVGLNVVEGALPFDTGTAGCFYYVAGNLHRAFLCLPAGNSSPAPSAQSPEHSPQQRPGQPGRAVSPDATRIVSLCGEWLFRPDPDDRGTKSEWYGVNPPVEDWRSVNVPHTWQVEASLTDYRGVAWYWRSF